jgi:hypothetical protein
LGSPTITMGTLTAFISTLMASTGIFMNSTTLTVLQQSHKRIRIRIRIPLTSNGNDIETKRSDTSIIGVFSVSKEKKPTFSRTWKDRSEANTTIIILCRIEEITNIIGPEFSGSKRNEHIWSKALYYRKRTDLIKIYAGSKQSEGSWPLYQQDRTEKEVQSPAGSKQKKCHNVGNIELYFLKEPEEQYTLH